MNKYYQTLNNILTKGKTQQNKKGNIQYLINESLSMNVEDLEAIFSEHKVARKLLAKELDIYMTGETSVDVYNKAGIKWWDYCAPTLVNSYPTYFAKLPGLIAKINKEKRSSKNYVLFIGATGVETNQLPCLSLMQFQISEGELYITVFQRSADSSLGLPSDIYQTTLIADMIDIPLANITYFIGNAHIYENNIEPTKELLNGNPAKFNLNV
jgi:thymidylate synthase